MQKKKLRDRCFNMQSRTLNEIPQEEDLGTRYCITQDLKNIAMSLEPVFFSMVQIFVLFLLASVVTAEA